MPRLLAIALIAGASLGAAHAGDSDTSTVAAQIVAVSHLHAGQKLVASGKLEAAEQEFTLAIVSYPDSGVLYLNRGNVRYQLKKYADAIPDFDAYLSYQPKDLKVLFLRGIAKSLLKPEDVAGSCADFNAAKSAGLSMAGIGGLDKYCKGQPNWPGN